MGKAALILVIASVYSWTMTLSNRAATFMDREDKQAFYEEKVLAREQALIGFNEVVANTVGDFDNYRLDLFDKTYRDGGFSISALSNTKDTVNVFATGTVGRAEYTFFGNIVERGGTKLAALNIDGPVSSATGIGGSYGFTGVNTHPDDPPGVATGKGPNASGVHSILKSADTELQDGFRDELVTGGKTGEPGSFTSGENEYVNFDKLSDTILGLCKPPSVHPSCITLHGDQVIAGNDVFGSREHPVIMIVDGDATFRGEIKGYGVLYIKGDFKTEVGKPRWEGLIYAPTAGGNRELRGQPEIYGAIVLRSTDEHGVPATTPEEKEELAPINITVRGEPNVHFSASALTNLSFLSKELPQMLKSEPITGALINVQQAASNDITHPNVY